MPKNILIYFFYDVDGIIDLYVDYFLKSIRDYYDEICIVSNSQIEKGCYERITKLVNKIIIRNNVGFDSEAYKEAIESYGYEIIGKLNSLLLCNFTMYGPIFPLDEMFLRMKDQNVDFWGLYLDEGNESIKIGDAINIPHLVNNFICFNNSVVSSRYFKLYWDNLVIPTIYEQSIINHELKCTNYFSDLGFTFSSYIDYRNYANLPDCLDSPNILISNPLKLFKIERNPFVMRKFFEYNFISRDFDYARDNPKDLVNYIKKNTYYDIGLIKDNLLRTYWHKENVLSL